ncbi:hypothetical protein C6A37_02780 [Desulfobacteraceae bacterium SEEP-SAG9]|nr:hypothetical protein C6A37_02780 [Desulfobacteraceae bacterium SEEP-SAG9]
MNFPFLSPKPDEPEPKKLVFYISQLLSRKHESTKIRKYEKFFLLFCLSVFAIDFYFYHKNRKFYLEGTKAK